MKFKKHITDVKKLDNGGFAGYASNEFINFFLSNDDGRCKFKRGDRIIKNAYAQGDINKIGTKGIIAGTYYDENIKKGSYLVKFEDKEELVLVFEEKLKLLE